MNFIVDSEFNKINLPKPFYPQSLNRQWHHIDWKEFSSINLDKLSLNFDPAIFHKVLPFVAYCNIENEFKDGVDSNFLKLYRLAQLLIEYLILTQQQLTERCETLTKERDQLTVTLEGQRLRLKELKGIRKTKHKNYLSDRIIKSKTLHPCSICDKHFFSREFLRSHIERRHTNVHLLAHTTPLHTVPSDEQQVGVQEEFKQSQQTQSGEFEVLIEQLQMQLKELILKHDREMEILNNQQQMREENFSSALNKKVLERVSSLEQVFMKKVNELFTTNQRDLILNTEEEATRIGDFKQEISSEMAELLQRIEKMDYKYADFQNKLGETNFKPSRSNLGELEDDTIDVTLHNEINSPISPIILKSGYDIEQQKVEEFIEKRLGVELEKIQEQLRAEWLKTISENSENLKKSYGSILIENPSSPSEELNEQIILTGQQKQGKSSLSSNTTCIPNFDIRSSDKVHPVRDSESCISNSSSYSQSPKQIFTTITGNSEKDFPKSPSSSIDSLYTKKCSDNMNLSESPPFKPNCVGAPPYNNDEKCLTKPENVLSESKQTFFRENTPGKIHEPYPNTLSEIRALHPTSSSCIKYIRDELESLLLSSLEKKGLHIDKCRLSITSSSFLIKELFSVRESYSLKYPEYYFARRTISDDLDMLTNKKFSRNVSLPIALPLTIDGANFTDINCFPNCKEHFPKPTSLSYSHVIGGSLKNELKDIDLHQKDKILVNADNSDRIQKNRSEQLLDDVHPDSLQYIDFNEKTIEESIPSDFSLSDITDNTDCCMETTGRKDNVISTFNQEDMFKNIPQNIDDFESDFSDS